MCRKQLSSLFNNTTFHETITQILNNFMSRGSPHFWVKYMMPEDVKSHSTTSGSNGTVPFDVTEFEQLMTEARAVLSRYIHFISWMHWLITTALKLNKPVTNHEEFSIPFLRF